MTKQNRGRWGLQAGTELPPVLQGMTAMSYLQLHIKTSCVLAKVISV